MKCSGGNPIETVPKDGISAGFCNTRATVVTDEHSVSLNGMVPLPDDETIINSIDYFHGITVDRAKPKYVNMHKKPTASKKAKK